MDRLKQIVLDPRLWIVYLLGLTWLVVMPRLGSYGFTEPHEINIAERARKLAEADDDKAKTVEGADTRAVPTAKPRPKPKQIRPELTDRVIGHALSGDGPSEAAARRPLALVGVFVVFVVFMLGVRLASPRAGLLSGLVLLSTPLFIFQTRQLSSDIITLAAGATAMIGALGLTLRAGFGWGEHKSWMYAVDLALAALGGVVGFYAAGAMVGIVVPFGAVFLAGLVAVVIERRSRADDSNDSPVGNQALLIGTAVAGAIALAFLGITLADVFDIVKAKPDDLHLLDYTAAPTNEYSAYLGGKWRAAGDLKVNFNILFEQIAFGLFPWVALAPLAVARLGTGRGGTARSFGGYALFAWALLAWLVGSVMARKVGAPVFAGTTAVALAVGIWLDDLLAARERSEDSSGRSLALPAVAAFVFLAANVVGKDMVAFPEKLASVSSVAGAVKVPGKGLLFYSYVGLGVIAATLLAVGIALLPPTAKTRAAAAGKSGFYRLVPRMRVLAGRFGIHAAVCFTTVAALVLSQGFVPGLAKVTSSRHVFEVYRDVAKPGEPLGVLGNPGTGSKYYAGEHEKLRSRKDLGEFLKREGRVFALTRKTELCPVHRDAAKQGYEYHVLDDSNAQLMLLSNKLGPGEQDKNLLVSAIRREPPTREIKTPLAFNLDDKLDLIGVTMPSQVDRGESYEMILFFKVKKKLTRNWKIFVHVEGGGLKFQADHKPLDGLCGTNYWQPGDYIVDRFQVEAGGRTFARGSYRANVGLFYGSSGNWTNMPVKTKGADQDNRIPVGSIRLR